MKQLFIILLFAAGLQPAWAQSIGSYNATELNTRISGKDTLYIVNFWATWCIPCVKELPGFNMVNDLYKDRPVKVLLVSFDFREQYPQALSAWVKKKKLHPEVAWLNESNPNEYIPKLAPEWEGGLPATLLINNKTGTRVLKPGEVTAAELTAWIDQQLK